MMPASFFESFPFILAFSALAGAARWHLTKPRTKIIYCLGEIICGVLAGSMAYGFLYNHDVRNGLLFTGSLAGAYLGGDLLDKVKAIAESKLDAPAARGARPSKNTNRVSQRRAQVLLHKSGARGRKKAKK